MKLLFFRLTARLVPTAANLILYGCTGSHVAWYSNTKELFGGSRDSKLIVSLTLGSPAPAVRRARVGFIIGACQDEFAHWENG